MTDPASVLWDVVVIGAGMGGATAGHALAAAGQRVLFIEKGRDNFPRAQPFGVQFEDPGERLDAAHWPARITMRVDGRERDVFAPLGCGSGGSTTIYAAALERLERDDLEPAAGSGWPAWPISQEEMRGWYAAAERLYRVVGTPDPLASERYEGMPPPPPSSPVDDSLMAGFAYAGLHPYRLHVGIGYVPGCGECGGRPCPKPCKSDANAICLKPALARHGASVLSETEVVRIESKRDRIEAVECRRAGETLRIRGRMFVLAAGAYRTPALLLHSSSPRWPQGLANGSDQVGRNLMFHATEMFAVWPHAAASHEGPRKTIGLRDFYRFGGERYGSFQSTGLDADYGTILHTLLARLERGPFGRVRLLRTLLRIPARLAALAFGRATIFALLIEDRPLADNRVVLDRAEPGRVVVEYTIPDELRRRANAARRFVRRRLGARWVLPLQTDVELNAGHPCGTCRMGDDPGRSVVDRDGKAHEIDNLYIADASVFPSSGGANPSLTIAANALRVADAVRQRLENPCTVAAS